MSDQAHAPRWRGATGMRIIIAIADEIVSSPKRQRHGVAHERSKSIRVRLIMSKGTVLILIGPEYEDLELLVDGRRNDGSCS
ncbi:MAG: hypothetical protein ACT4P7_10365 [Gemmatimonadaceae bacterium]